MRHRPTIFLGLVLVASFGASPEAASTTSPIHVDTAVTEKYYDVRGASPKEVFSSIQAHGLGGRAGLSASGLTESDLNYTLSTSTDHLGCHLDDLSLEMSVTVTLPRHADPRALDPNSQKHWQAYEAQVEFHEYRHVEIEFQGLQELSSELASKVEAGLLDSSTDCRTIVQEAVARQIKITRGRHEKFHVEQSREIHLAQKKLLSQIDTLDKELREKRVGLNRLSTELAATETNRAHAAREFQALIDTYGQELPPSPFARAEELAAITETLGQESDELRTLHDVLVSDHNDLVEERRGLARSLAWTR